MTDWPTATAILRIDPRGRGGRLRGWLIADCGEDWLGYYERYMIREGGGQWVKDRNGKLQWRNHTLQRPALGPHISVIRGDRRTRGNNKDWRKLNGLEITFSYDPDLADNGDHISDGRHYFMLWVNSPELEDIRASFGLNPHPPQSRHRRLHGVGDQPAPFYMTLGTLHMPLGLAADPS